jgi:hypothetical protein
VSDTVQTKQNWCFSTPPSHGNEIAEFYFSIFSCRSDFSISLLLKLFSEEDEVTTSSEEYWQRFGGSQ